MPRRTLALLASSILAVVVAACSGAAGAATTAPTAAGPTATSASAGADATASSGSVAAGKVSANSASEAEIAAALRAAGVPNADRWAREVTEYRPYPTDDPTLAKLQDNLAKYRPAAATLAGILSALKP